MSTPDAPTQVTPAGSPIQMAPTDTSAQMEVEGKCVFFSSHEIVSIVPPPMYVFKKGIRRGKLEVE